MFHKILIANRGEIACRIIRTCRRLGITTVAVYSSADRGSPHVALADEAYHLGPDNATSSYLDMAAVLAAAQRSGAVAIHPGYGFLSENADFARRVARAGLIFIGPRPETIAAMGLKSAAKATMERAGVPVIPGYHGEEQDDDRLLSEARRLGFPLMIKASAGGGGKGIRIVRKADEFRTALAGARREAQAAFGNARILLERYIEHPRHIEFQIFADNFTTTVHLFERECSLQRRFQKVVEEAPSPLLAEPVRAAMGAAAVAAARAVDYLNAGTVEFIVGADQSFYFMEMNTRLQVEHAITEETTGIDLVEWQLRIAAGEPLPLSQDRIHRHGHAIEARIYAEDPTREFLPAPGLLAALHWPKGNGVRIDTGVQVDSNIGTAYDPMVAKLVVCAPDRDAAIHRLRKSLASTSLFGLTTNLTLLRGLAAHPQFAAGNYDTVFLDRELDTILAPIPLAPWHAAAALARFLHDLSLTTPGPWRPDAFRVVPGEGWRFGLAREESGETSHWRVQIRPPDLLLYAESATEPVRIRATALPNETWLLELDGHEQRRVTVRRHRSRFHLSDGEQALDLVWSAAFTPDPQRRSGETNPLSPMPGQVVAVHVAAGDRVRKGDPLVTLEGMKMEYTVRARNDGIARKIHCREGERIEAEVILIEIDAAEPADA